MTRIVAMRSINGTNSHGLEYASRRGEETDQNRSDSSIRNRGADGVHGRLFAASRRDALPQRTSCPWSPAVGGCSERSQAFVACIAGGRERSAYRRLATNMRITLARRRKNWRIGCHRLAVEALP